jgi:hypothetical protein
METYLAMVREASLKGRKGSINQIGGTIIPYLLDENLEFENTTQREKKNFTWRIARGCLPMRDCLQN